MPLVLSDDLRRVLNDQFETLRSGLPDGETFGEWLDSGAPLSAFDHSSERHDESVFSLGYLTGFGEAHGLTLLGLLEELGLGEVS